MNIKVDENISLRFLEEQDATMLLNLVNANRAYLRQWLPWVDNMQTVDHFKIYINDSIKRTAEKTDFGFAIIFKDQLAGRIGLHHINLQNKIGEIGYWLADGMQGNGIVTKCCKAIMQYGFTQMGLNRIEIKCAVGNKRSRAIAQKLNFKEEGILQQAEWLNGSYVNLYLYAMLKEDWMNEVDEKK
ncbi:MAG: GNAT family N-acetyltransferase [Ferruginibacter sp.]|nr:GNAT family N-acetyltransferase [Ferruginibacter sp.]